ncbi:putative sporulation protein YtxC [Niallia sp. Krafla_26]|uniref:putative sporulation protein YtxC n=1 Tax=Niallia sp. Krafla_26 TaxID=3064703 RepID=UPI003D16E387
MLEIQFQHKHDARKLHVFLNQLLERESSPIYILQNEDSHIVKCNGAVHQEKERFIHWAKEALCQFIMKVKLNDWLREILRDKYHYRDEEEQQQIMDIIHSVLEGRHEELATFLPKFSMKEYLMDHINQWFHEHKTFSFDAFVTFRLRSLLKELRKYVELSLDEYRMEQEYQMFIQMLREFLLGREPKIEQIHLICIEETITFFDQGFNEIKKAELTKMVDRKLLINHPIYIDSSTIAPLLSIAPLKINIYTSEPDKPILRTIRNIFEERLIIEETNSFEKRKKEYTSLLNEKYNTP